MDLTPALSLVDGEDCLPQIQEVIAASRAPMRGSPDVKEFPALRFGVRLIHLHALIFV